VAPSRWPSRSHVPSDAEAAGAQATRSREAERDTHHGELRTARSEAEKMRSASGLGLDSGCALVCLTCSAARAELSELQVRLGVSASGLEGERSMTARLSAELKECQQKLEISRTELADSEVSLESFPPVVVWLSW
jgi:hypothetical protein